MEELKLLAAAAVRELRSNPPVDAKLPNVRAFADALNEEVSRPGLFDERPWERIAEALGVRFGNGDDPQLWLWGVAGKASLIAVPIRNLRIDQSKLVANVLKFCEVLAHS